MPDSFAICEALNNLFCKRTRSTFDSFSLNPIDLSFFSMLDLSKIAVDYFYCKITYYVPVVNTIFRSIRGTLLHGLIAL